MRKVKFVVRVTNFNWLHDNNNNNYIDKSSNNDNNNGDNDNYIQDDNIHDSTGDKFVKFEDLNKRTYQLNWECSTKR